MKDWNELKKIDEIKPIINDEVLEKNKKQQLKRDADLKKQERINNIKNITFTILCFIFIALFIVAFNLKVLEICK